MDCQIYRGSRQPDLYLYLRTDVQVTELPPELLKRLGSLTLVMQLTLNRRLARVDVAQVRAQLASVGYFVQFPDSGLLHAHLHFGD